MLIPLDPFTEDEALLIFELVSQAYLSALPPEGRKGTAKQRKRLRNCDAIMVKLGNLYPGFIQLRNEFHASRK